MMKQIICILLLCLIISKVNASKAKAMAKLMAKAKLKIATESFIEEKNKVQAESMAKSKDTLAYAMRLSNLNRQDDDLDGNNGLQNPRKTVGGLRCAQEFLTMDKLTKVVRDCTISEEPNGMETGKEWCFTNPQKEEWDYCIPTLDYNKGRMQVSKNLLKKTLEIRQLKTLAEKIAANIKPIQKQIKSKNNQQKKLINFFDKILLKQQELDTGMTQLNALKEQWEQLEMKIVETANEIAELKKGSKSLNPKYCNGMLGYEEDVIGTGINGFYYDNEMLIGTPFERIDEEIDFEWEKDPIGGVNVDNFSVSWQGFVKAPATGEYTFQIHTDDGAKLLINDEAVLSHNWSVVNDPDVNWLTCMHMEEDAQKQIIDSEIVKLNGGDKYSLKLMIYHSSHNAFTKKTNPFVTLKWSSDLFTVEDIPMENLFPGKIPTPLQVTGYFKDKFQLNLMRDQQKVFMDTETYWMNDVPKFYENLHFLQSTSQYMDQNITLTTNDDVNIYLCTDYNDPKILDNDWFDTEEYISVLKVAIPKAAPKDNIVIAKQNIPFRIYKKSFGKGQFTIPLIFPHEKPFVQFVLFYKLDELAGGEKPSCGGMELIISDPNSESYEGCSSSSYKEKFECQFGLSTKMVDDEFNMWVSDGEGLDSWIEIEFKKKYLITKWDYKNRENPAERNKLIKVEFSNGFTYDQELRNSAITETFNLEDPQVASKVRFTVVEVYSALNNGGAINIYGIACDEREPKEDLSEDNVISLGCKDNMINNEAIILRQYGVGDRFLVGCYSNCVDEAQAYPAYGAKQYSIDTAICLSAFHDGALNPMGGHIIIELNDGQLKYVGESQNGVQSLDRDGNVNVPSISFEAVPDPEQIIKDLPIDGMLVDLYDKKDGLWVEGTVKEVMKQNKKVRLVVNRKGFPDSENVAVDWPDPANIDFCGEQLTDRVCDEDSQKPETGVFQANICFTPLDACEDMASLAGQPPTYIVDNGKQFGEVEWEEKKYEFGWSRDMTAMARKRDINPDMLLDAFMMFPPDPKSVQCQAPNPEVSCEPTQWSITVPIGRYQVKVTFGDAENKSGYTIQVNGHKLIKGTLLEADQFETEQIIVEAPQGNIIIRADCNMSDPPENFCDQVWTKINVVKIEQIFGEDDSSSDDEDSGIQNLGCMNAFVKGRCDEGKELENCIYEDLTNKMIPKCAGLFKVVQIPDDYECKNQRKWYKCLKAKFESEKECKDTCPGKCLNNECLVKNTE